MKFSTVTLLIRSNFFLGIPLLHEGLMTDILDEFDHALGRDRNVDSEDKNGTQANQMIEAAIDQYYV